MRTVRIWLLLILAVLLPVRGAVAAAMLCPAGESGMQSEVVLHAVPAVHEAMDHAMAHGEHSGGHDDATHHHSGHDHGLVDKCNLCSAFCSLTPLMSTPPGLPPPPALATVKFPALSTPAPRFVSDGQERPPRTI